MAQEDKKNRPNFLERGNGNNDDRNQKRTPRFSIYWIYALIAVILIGYNFWNFDSPKVVKTNEKEFKENMLLTGDVEKLVSIRNKELVKVYIKKDSLHKPFYANKFKNVTPDAQKGPQFEMKVTDCKKIKMSIFAHLFGPVVQWIE